jgi:transcriptional/translational regulatory protein YebC/TACO1
MAGHSKWANIKHRKAAQDARRGKIFTKIIRELTVAARQGGGNPDDNPRLRAVIDKALTANMKKDTIERAVERGAGGGDDDNYEELTYEGYGPEWEEDRLVEAVLSAGAEDLAAQDDGSWEIVTTPEQFLDVKESLVNAGLVPDNAEVTMVPSTRVELDRDGAETILKLIDMLEDLDDVQNVYHNADISGEIMESL